MTPPPRRSCWWDDEADAGRVGAWFTGRNELPDRTWETHAGILTTLASIKQIAETA